MIKLNRIKYFLSQNGFSIRKLRRDVITADKTRKIVETYELRKKKTIFYLHVKISGEPLYVLSAPMKNNEMKSIIQAKTQDEFVNQMHLFLHFRKGDNNYVNPQG